MNFSQKENEYFFSGKRLDNIGLMDHTQAMLSKIKNCNAVNSNTLGKTSLSKAGPDKGSLYRLAATTTKFAKLSTPSIVILIQGIFHSLFALLTNCFSPMAQFFALLSLSCLLS